MIDTHAHLDFPQFDEDRREVLERFFQSGGSALINVGVDKERNKKSLEIAQSRQNVFAAAGFHPHEAREGFSFPEMTKQLKNQVRNEKIVAIGEIGLDYFRINSPKEKDLQKKLFVSQLEIAKEIGLPVIIHCREAYGDLLEIIAQKEFSGLSLVLHCFSGKEEDLEKFLQIPELMFSYTGNITFVKEGDDLLKTVEKTPLSRMMVETDCPFLAPVPYRGKRNEPFFVKEVIAKIALVKSLPFEEVEKQTDQNAIKFFRLSYADQNSSR
jgi:TatD DNase family protein